MADVNQNQVLDLLRKAENILIAPSQPDGDSVGSSLALMSSLRKMGKNVTVVYTYDIPDYLAFLPLIDQFQANIHASNDFVISVSTKGADVDHLKYEVENDKINIIITPKNGLFKGHDVSFKSGAGDFDLVITVDTGDLVQLGKFYEESPEIFKNYPVLNIDHHASNGRFGTHNFLDFQAASTTQMITPIIQTLEKEFQQEHPHEELIDEDVATLLLVGIITDTGSFQHSNTTPDAFEVAADLLDRGARQQEIIKHIFKTKSLATLKLWGRTLSQIQYMPESKFVFSTISQEDLAATGATADDSGGIIDELMSNAPDAEVVMLLKEKEPGFISGSLRAPGKRADVSLVAQKLGGGGHKKAAGFRIREKSMSEALEIAKAAVQEYMQELGPEQLVEEGKLFPGLVVKPQSSIPKVSEGGEDLLLKDFRNRKDDKRDKVAAFFQDKDGQEKVETVEDALQKIADAQSN